MPRDSNKNNDSSRGRRDRPPGGKGAPKARSGAARGPEKKFAKRDFAGKAPEGRKPYSGPGKPYAGKRVGPPPPRDDGGRPKRDFNDRPRRDFSDRPKRDFSEGGEKRPYAPRPPRDDRAPRSDNRPAGRFADKKFGEKKFGEKRPYTPRPDGDRPRRDRPEGDRPFKPRDDRPRGDRPFAEKRFGGEKKFGDKKFGDKKFGDRPQGRGAPDRGPRRDSSDRPPRRDFSERSDRGERKPWQDKPYQDKAFREKPRQDRSNSAPHGDRPVRSFDKPKFERPRDPGTPERPRFSRPREDRPREDRPRENRSSGEGRFRPAESRKAWQEHPRSETPNRDDRPRRDNEDDSKVFAKRPAFGGRGAYRERDPDERRPPRPPAPVKSGERIAKIVARAGLCSRRDAEDWITQGRVSVNGRVITSPALDVTSRDVVTIDGKPLPPPERTRLFLFHKPRGLMTTHSDPEGRPTVFDNLPEGLPRLISIGRLDFNTEGLLLLTNDGGLARALELPDTGWLRRYRVRAHGEVTQGQLDQLRDGVEVEGVKYGPIDAQLERDQGANVWLVFAIREGKNREVRNVLAHLGLEVNRLIRVSYGPFQLSEIEEGQVEEVKTRVLREQLGEKIAASAQANFARAPEPKGEASDDPQVRQAPAKRGVVQDRKGRRVLVQRSGSDEARARNESEANGYGPPRRPKRGYHGKRDLAPRD